MKRLLASLAAVLALVAGLASLSPPSPAALFASHYPASTCAPQPLPISRVRGALTPVGDGTSATTLVLTLSAAVTSGDAIVGLVSFDIGASNAISSIVDNKGNPYTLIDTEPDTTNQQSAATFYATNITNAPTSITITFNTPTAFRYALADELVNVAKVTPLDGHTANLQLAATNAPDNVTSGSITTHNAKDAVWGGIMLENTNTISAGTGFAIGGSNTNMASELLIQTVAGTRAATFTLAFGSQATSFVVGFIAQSSCGGAPPPPPTVLATATFNGGDSSIETNAEAFEATLGKPLAFVLQFGGNASESDFTGSTGFEFSLSPTSRKLLYSQPLIWTGATLAAAAAGTYDADYQSVANAIGTAYAAGQVYAVRIGWEENGTWYPWNIHTGSPADYVTAWRDFALKIKAAAPGIKLDWNSNWGQADAAAAYPGDDVVDIISMDAYDNTAFPPGGGTACATRWAAFVTQPAGFASLTTMQTFATAHAKPMAISEYGSNYNDGCFIQNIHDWITARNFAWHDYWNSTSAFNGLLSNYPINLSTYLNLWGTPSTGQVIAAGKEYWGVNGHNDTGSDGYGTSTNATKIADMKTVMGSTANSIPYRGVPAGYGNYATDVNAMVAANIIPQVMVGAFPNFSGYANATAAYNGGYADMQSAINGAPAARLFEIGNEWTIFNGGVSPAYDTFINDGSHAADWRGQVWYARMLGYTAGAVAAVRDLCAPCQVIGGAYAGWVPFGLPLAMGVDLQTYVPPGGSTRDLRWDFTVVHWYQDTSCGGNNMGTDLSNFNGGMNLYTGLKPIGKPIMLTEFGSVACSSSDATAAGFVTALMNNFLAHKATTGTETGVAGGNFYQLYNADTGSWLLDSPGGSVTAEGTAYKNFLIAHGNPS